MIDKLSDKTKKIIFAIVLIFITQNIFFDIYRGAAFDLMPHDDYGPYLLYIIGEEGGHIPISPYPYRFISVAAAIPFYYILPSYRFTYLEDGSENHLRALSALSFVSYLSILISALFLYLMTKNRFGGSQAAALLVLILTIIMFQNIRPYGIDQFAIMFLIIALYYFKNKAAFITLILLSTAVNEKIFFIFGLIIVSRLVFKKQKFEYHLLSPFIAALIYIPVVIMFQTPENANQTQPITYLDGFIKNLGYTFSFKGLLVNVLPVMMIVFFYYLSHLEFKKRDYDKLYFNPIDILPLILLFLYVHAINVDYNVGRICMLLFPLYLPLAVIYASGFLERASVVKSK